MSRSVHGIFLLDKPANISSNAALQKVKRLFQAKKAGHTGSLDPIATGMLPICFGEATKFSQFLLDSDKTYHVVAKLGQQTTTGDREGEVIATQSVSGVTAAQIEQVMTQFIGNQNQVPPMYSAIKYQGNPLYKLARKGIEVERKPRLITIFSLHFKSLVDDCLTFEVHCSKGTYVRTLVEDIARALGYGGHVLELCRLSVHPYHQSMMCSLPELEALAVQEGLMGLERHLLPVETSLQTFPSIKLTSSAAFYLRMGQSVRINASLSNQFVRLQSEEDQFLGVGELLPDGRVKPHRLIASG